MPRTIAAWSVHLFTACGAVLALFALLSVQDHRWTEAMLWLFAALVVDGIDGTLARAAHTKQLAPRVDGDVLDLVVDYLNYVFVPTIFMLDAGVLPEPLALPLAGLIQISSLYAFARKDMKTEDGYFRGFPALWNIVALYLYAGGLGQAPAAVLVGTFVLLTFAPVHVVHPFRVRDYGPWLWLVAVAWALTTVALLLPFGNEFPRNLLLWLSSLCAALLILPGLRRTLKRKGRDGRPPRPIS